MTSTTKTRKPKAPEQHFDYHEALRLVDEIFSKPPVKAHSKRPNDLGWGIRVARFVAPAHLCLSSNATGRRAFAAFDHAEIKDKLWAKLEEQYLAQLSHLRVFNLPISRAYIPRVYGVKFSSRSPDVGANSVKAAVDMLTVPKLVNREENRWTKRRMSIIRDDRPEVVDQIHWWEFLPEKHQAFVLVEVRCPMTPNNPERKRNVTCKR